MAEQEVKEELTDSATLFSTSGSLEFLPHKLENNHFFRRYNLKISTDHEGNV
jgi:hypothetical protein